MIVNNKSPIRMYTRIWGWGAGNCTHLHTLHQPSSSNHYHYSDAFRDWTKQCLSSARNDSPSRRPRCRHILDLKPSQGQDSQSHRELQWLVLLLRKSKQLASRDLFLVILYKAMFINSTITQLTVSVEAQLVADYSGIVLLPALVDDSTPNILKADLHTTFVRARTVSQTDVSICTRWPCTMSREDVLEGPDMASQCSTMACHYNMYIHLRTYFQACL